MNRLELLSRKTYRCVGTNSLFYDDTLISIFGEDTIEDRPLEMDEDMPGDFRTAHDILMEGSLTIDKIVHASKTDTYLELKSKDSLLVLIDDLKEIISIIGSRMNTNRRYSDVTIPYFSASLTEIKDLREELINNNKKLVEAYYNKPQDVTPWDILPGINLKSNKLGIKDEDKITSEDVINEIKGGNGIYDIARKSKYRRRK